MTPGQPMHEQSRMKVPIPAGASGWSGARRKMGRVSPAVGGCPTSFTAGLPGFAPRSPPCPSVPPTPTSKPRPWPRPFRSPRPRRGVSCWNSTCRCATPASAGCACAANGRGRRMRPGWWWRAAFPRARKWPATNAAKAGGRPRSARAAPSIPTAGACWPLTGSAPTAASTSPSIPPTRPTRWPRCSTASRCRACRLLWAPATAPWSGCSSPPATATGSTAWWRFPAPIARTPTPAPGARCSGKWWPWAGKKGRCRARFRWRGSGPC